MKSFRYTLQPGSPWERLIVVKDRRTRRPRKLVSARSVMQHSTTLETYEFTVSVSYEGGASLCVPSLDTLDLTPGVWQFDLVGDFRGQVEKLAQGEVTVEALSTITPMDGGSVSTINYDQFTDYRKVFTWLDTDGNTLTATDARLQVKNTDGTLVFDLGFFATPPDEATIGTLDPDKRGYVSPIVDATVEVHISNQAVIAAGSYVYDLMVLESGGDWGQLAKGAFIVDESVTDPSS